jgi:hypothetical protein
MIELREHVDAIFIIHHTKKRSSDTKSNNELARGSSDITNSVDTHFLLEQSSEGNYITLKGVKNRMDSIMHEYPFKIIGDEEHLTINFEGVKRDFIESKRKKTENLIIESLEAHGTASFDEIVSFVKDGHGYSENIIRQILKEMTERKDLITGKKGNKAVYVLSREENEPITIFDDIGTPQQFTPLGEK